MTVIDCTSGCQPDMLLFIVKTKDVRVPSGTGVIAAQAKMAH